MTLPRALRRSSRCRFNTFHTPNSPRPLPDHAPPPPLGSLTAAALNTFPRSKTLSSVLLAQGKARPFAAGNINTHTIMGRKQDMLSPSPVLLQGLHFHIQPETMKAQSAEGRAAALRHAETNATTQHRRPPATLPPLPGVAHTHTLPDSITLHFPAGCWSSYCCSFYYCFSGYPELCTAYSDSLYDGSQPYPCPKARRWDAPPL